MEHIIDVKDKKLGRVASQIALILQGKNKATYEKNKSGTDVVIIKNISGIVVTGKKEDQKIYYRHSGKIGHLKETKYKRVFDKDPKWVLQNAVRLMLPKNKLRAKRIRRLKFQ